MIVSDVVRLLSATNRPNLALKHIKRTSVNAEVIKWSSHRMTPIKNGELNQNPVTKWTLSGPQICTATPALTTNVLSNHLVQLPGSSI